jgi:hypothetical protein
VKGQLDKKILTVKNIFGKEEWESAPQDLFVKASAEEHLSFNVSLLSNTGFVRGRIFSPIQKDYPLVYETYVWSPITHTMTLIFYDLNTPQWKSVKSRDARNVEAANIEIPREWESDSEFSNLKFRLDDVDGFFPIGNPLAFSTQENAEREITAWKARMRIRRFKSAVDPSDGMYTVECFNREGECKPYVVRASHRAGHPAYFSSRIVAGLSIAVLGSETWKNSYAHTIDRVG